MNNFFSKANLPKIYNTAAILAFVYAGLMIVFSIYKDFIYVDQTWLHGLTVNGFSVFSNLIWIGLLLVLKVLLNKTLQYNKANSLINASFIFLGIGVYSVGVIFFKALKVYFSSDDANALFSFGESSISSAIWLLLSSVVLIVIDIILGNRLRKINIVLKDYFKILGFSFIVYGVVSALQMVKVISSDIIVFLPKIVLIVVLGNIFKEVSKMNPADLPSEPEPKVAVNYTPAKTFSENKTEKVEKINVSNRKKEIAEQEVIPTFDINELENKEEILSYFENLSNDEKNRLGVVVAKIYNQDLTAEQTKNLILHYITEKKLYDHNRFAPK
ncbi:MAG: hypothetical protein REI96_11445 [Flavobacterium nitrogenifigens]|uniref:hypothetical protein n=1 Tax=Flavobacterium nitrogenifigens TaxID=1617283 RepID=UPI00280665AB|nr:hypothetical protein [Flavobacterium nitrogenifigens]MDQ8013056.1 hypothetical protein [Flavobacterium nitrogenifigens]